MLEVCQRIDKVADLSILSTGVAMTMTMTNYFGSKIS